MKQLSPVEQETEEIHGLDSGVEITTARSRSFGNLIVFSHNRIHLSLGPDCIHPMTQTSLPLVLWSFLSLSPMDFIC